MACVSSALKQTYLNRQIIVVNDGSDDATKAILDSIDQLFEDSIPYKEQFIIVN